MPFPKASWNTNSSRHLTASIYPQSEAILLALAAMARPLLNASNNLWFNASVSFARIRISNCASRPLFTRSTDCMVTSSMPRSSLLRAMVQIRLLRALRFTARMICRVIVRPSSILLNELFHSKPASNLFAIGSINVSKLGCFLFLTIRLLRLTISEAIWYHTLSRHSYKLTHCLHCRDGPYE